MTIKPPFLRTPYNYDTNKAGDESGLQCDDPSLAQQHFAEECDINTIVKRFAITGELPTNVRMPSYGDFTTVNNFHDALNAVALANEAFDRMPADVRARFHNDPGKFVDFCADQNNLEEARKLGLVPAREVQPAFSLTGDPPPPAAAPAAPTGRPAPAPAAPTGRPAPAPAAPTGRPASASKGETE